VIDYRICAAMPQDPHPAQPYRVRPAGAASSGQDIASTTQKIVYRIKRALRDDCLYQHQNPAVFMRFA
jgi:hypothetical protein